MFVCVPFYSAIKQYIETTPQTAAESHVLTPIFTVTCTLHCCWLSPKIHTKFLLISGTYWTRVFIRRQRCGYKIISRIFMTTKLVVCVYGCLTYRYSTKRDPLWSLFCCVIFLEAVDVAKLKHSVHLDPHWDNFKVSI